MKYIRTKYRIFEVVKEDDEWVDIISNFEREMECHACMKKKAIIKQADTIEELCDCKVIALKNEEHFLLTIPLKDIYEKAFYKEIYGAIWTDKGLIYVAKINEKGELELL